MPTNPSVWLHQISQTSENTAYPASQQAHCSTNVSYTLTHDAGASVWRRSENKPDAVHPVTIRVALAAAVSAAASAATDFV